MAPGAAAAADTQTLLEHQQVIAQTHPDGSYFLTPEGAYVQLVNGVLRTVDLGAQVPYSRTHQLVGYLPIHEKNRIQKSHATVPLTL